MNLLSLIPTCNHYNIILAPHYNDIFFIKMSHGPKNNLQKRFIYSYIIKDHQIKFSQEIYIRCTKFAVIAGLALKLRASRAIDRQSVFFLCCRWTRRGTMCMVWILVAWRRPTQVRAQCHAFCVCCADGDGHTHICLSDSMCAYTRSSPEPLLPHQCAARHRKHGIRDVARRYRALMVGCCDGHSISIAPNWYLCFFFRTHFFRQAIPTQLHSARWMVEWHECARRSINYI